MVARLELVDKATSFEKESQVQFDDDDARTREREGTIAKTPSAIDLSRPRSNFYANSCKADPFPDSNALDIKTLEEQKASHAEMILNML